MTNARLTLRDSDGTLVVRDLNIVSFNTGLQLAMSNGQVKTYEAKRPIRISERSVMFECEWSEQNYEDMERLSNQIRNHHLYCIGVAQPEPMVFEYFTGGKTYRGWIEDVERGKERHKSKYSRTFQMRVMNNTRPPISMLTTGDPAPYIPTENNTVSTLRDWYTPRDPEIALSAADLNKYNGYWKGVIDRYLQRFAANGNAPQGGGGAPGDNGTAIAPGSSNPGPGNQVDNPPPGKSWARGKLSVDQMADLVLSAGLSGNHAALAVAISKRESSWTSTAHNGNAGTGDDSWGLWQINVIAGAMSPGNLAIYRAKDLTDPWTNAKAMMFLYTSAGRTFGSNWYTLDSGAPKIPPGWPSLNVSQNMPEAIAAINRHR